MARANNVKALIFDVFGTVVDWRASIKKGIQNIIPKKLTEEELLEERLEDELEISDEKFLGDQCKAI